MMPAGREWKLQTMRDRFRLAYMSRVPHPAFLEALSADPSLEAVRLSYDMPEADILAGLKGCRGYYVSSARHELAERWHLTSSLVSELPHLLLAVSYGAGYDTVDVEALSAAGIGLVNQAGGNAQAVAEHTLGMMLTLMKRTPEAHLAIKAGRASPRENFMGRELAGRTIGLVGLGHIGTRVAALLKAFGSKVLAVDPFLDAATCASRGAAKVDLGELLAECDVVSVHAPLTRLTRGMFDKAAFAAMRQGAVFINTARGGIHDEEALLEALRSGRLAAAGLDVWDVEPPDAQHPLLAHPAVLASQHIAGVTHESRERVSRMAAEAFSTFAAGRIPPRLVNPEIATRMMQRREAMASA
jgi:D-3-phosphoglycerate dehydrogenase